MKENENPLQGTPAEGNLAKTERVIDENRRYCTLDDSLSEMFITQLGAELANKHMYNTFSNYFDTDGLPKLAEYFKLRADEEELHHSWIFNYLGYNDVCFQYPAIKEITVNIKNRVDPFLFTVDREIETTMGIYKIMEEARELGDWGTVSWLMGNGPIAGKLIPEQIEEESVSRTIADMAQEENTSWLIKQDSILNFYKNR
jgi:ferritin